MGGGLRAAPPEVTSRARREALRDRAGPGPQAHSDVPVHRARLYKNPVIQDHAMGPANQGNQADYLLGTPNATLFNSVATIAMDGGMITITADTITLKAGTINLDPK